MVAARNLRAIASATFPEREHFGVVVRGQRAPLSVDFNGVLPAGVTLTGATWRCGAPWAVAMAGATFGERSSEVVITGTMGYAAVMRCEATASDGSVHVQTFVIQVAGRRGGSEPAIPSGPVSVEAVPV